MFTVQKRFTIFEGYLLSHTLSQWLYCMKIVQLAVDKMMRVEIWIEFHLYRPDISCDPDRLRERVKKKNFSVHSYNTSILSDLTTLGVPRSESWILSGISYNYLFKSHIFGIFSCCLGLLFVYRCNAKHISWNTHCLPVDRQVLKTTVSLSFVQDCQPVQWILRQIW